LTDQYDAKKETHPLNTIRNFCFNVSPASFGKYYSKLGCFCFEKQELNAGEKATYVMTFYLDPEMVNDPTTKNLEDVTMSYTFFSTDYYKQS